LGLILKKKNEDECIEASQAQNVEEDRIVLTKNIKLAGFVVPRTASLLLHSSAL